MAVGSWMGTPIMPDLIRPTTVIEAKMRQKGKGKDVAIVIDDD